MNRMTFWDHIDELRHRIFKSIFVLVLSSIFSYSYSNQIISILLSPLETIDMLTGGQDEILPGSGHTYSPKQDTSMYIGQGMGY